MRAERVPGAGAARGGPWLALAPLDEVPPCPLTPEEARFAAKLGPVRAREFRAGRALARHLLSKAVPQIAPRDWRLALPDGRAPAVLRNGFPVPALFLSLSHSRSHIAAALSIAGPIGIDLEPLDRPMPPGLGPRFLSPRDHPGHARALWCLKEAIAKAAGLGLAADLRAIELTGERGGWRIARLPAHPAFGPPAYWARPRLVTAAGHTIAIARRTTPNTMC